MSSKRKGLRYSQKQLDYKREDSTALRMKVLRSALALGVGFAMSPWLSRDAYAEGNGIVRAGSGQKNLLVNNVADIYAAKAANGVGLNAFQHFELGNNQIANLYFKTSANDTNVLNTLVNTVQNKISISGTVNAIRNGKIGGNLYFLSHEGMVVGSTGVINAGSLTVITSGKTFYDGYGDLDPNAAAAAIRDNDWNLSSDAAIDIHGKINTATGIDLRAAYINVTKAEGATAGPSLKTGVVFAQTVNTKDPALQAANITENRLTASVDSNGNVVLADPNEPNNDALKGDGSIKLAASSTSRNTATEFLGVSGYPNTAAAKVEVGQGATLDALGNVDITAHATISDLPAIAHFVDMSGYAKADVQVDGAITGNNVNINAKAQAAYSNNNHANLLDLINNLSGPLGVTVKSNLTSTIWNILDNAGKINGKVDILNKIVNQVYMPFNLCEADATINVGTNANIQAQKIISNGVGYGGDVKLNAASVAQNVMAVGLQPKVHAGDKDMAQYFVGGFLYEDSTSKAIINMDGVVNADRDVSLQAVAQNASSGSISVKAPQVYKVPNPTPDDPYESTMVAVGVGLVNQNTQAEINLGAQNNAASLTAANKLNINVASNNSLSSSVAMQNFRDTAVNVAINVVGSEGSATINNYAHLQGSSVDMAAAHTLSKYTVSNTNKINTEFTGLDWLINTSQVREGADALREFVRSFNQAGQDAAGDNVQAEEDGGAENVGQAPAWNDYFDLGATVTVASAANSAKINLKPTSVITATGDVSINSLMNIVDSKIVTENNFLNSSPNALAGVSAAVAVEFMDNTAEINMESSSSDVRNAINAGGSISLTANTEQRYNRAQTLVQDLLTAFYATKQYWTSWQSQADLNKKFQNLQNIVVDIASMVSADPSANFKNSPKFVAKAKSGIDLLTSLTGTEGIKKALEAFVDVSNYVNMHVSAGTDAKENKDTTAMVSGAVGVQKLTNTANINIGANAKLIAGNFADVNINANAVESNVLLVGKMALVPDVTSTSGCQIGLGGSVGVQNSYTNSRVQLLNGVQIDAGSIAIGSVNDILNLGIVFGGSETSKLGITGMVSYMGGASRAETLIDDDIDFTARKKVEHVLVDESASTYEDRVTSSGAIDISAENKTNVINLVGDWNASEASSVGVSTGVVSYAVQSVAAITNQELHADGSSAETGGDGGTAAQKGSIAGNGVAVHALTDGIINTLTVAGVNSSKSQNANAAAGGVNVVADGGQAAGGVQNAQINAGAAGGQDAVVKLNAVGSTSWNYVQDTTKAALDNVNITLTPATIGTGVTTAELLNDKTGFVKVEAEDASYIGAYSGAMALNQLGNNNHTAFQGALAGAVAVNDVQKNTTASLQNSSIQRQSNADVAVGVLNYAHNSGAQVAAGLSLGLDVGKRRGGVAVNLAGSGSANYVDSNVLAQLAGNNMVGGSTTVNNIAYDKDVQVAGGVTVETATATASVGAAVALNDVDNKTQATLQNNTIGAADKRATAVRNLAASALTQVGTAVSVGVAAGDQSYATLNAAVATNTVQNKVQATMAADAIHADTISVEAKDGKISLDTADNKYLVQLNQASSPAVNIAEDGSFTKDGVALQRAFAVYENGQKVYKVYTLNAAGNYEDAQGHELTCTVLTDASGNTTGLEYRDNNNNIVDVYDVHYIDSDAGTAVDINELKIENKHYFDLDGSGALLEANGTYGSDYTATVADNAQQASYTNTSIALTNQGNHIVGVALGLGVKAGNNGLAQGAGAAAVNTNSITNNFTASVKNATLSTGASSYAGSGALQEAALKVEAASDTSMVSVAAGVSVTAGGQDKVSLALAGSGAVQNIKNNTQASVENTVATTDYLSLKGSSSSSLVTVAGQVGVETSKKGIAAGFSWAENELDNTVGAYGRGLTLNGIGTEPAPSLALLAQNNAKAWAVSVGAGVALGYASAEGAYAENHGLNNTEAIVEAYKKQDGSYQNNTLTNAKNIAIEAEDNTVEKATAGTASVSLGYASLGGGAASNNIGNSADDKQSVRAFLSDATITTADSATINVLANNKAEFLTLALGAAVRAAGSSYIGVGAEGNAALTNLYTATEAGLKNVNISTTAANKALVEVESQSNTKITSSADAASITASSSGAQIGFSATVSKVRSDADTSTSIANSNITAKDILAKAASQNEILDVAVGMSVAVGQYAGIALAGNYASNIIDNDTTLGIDASTLKADGAVAALASSKELLKNYGGGVSVGVGTSAAGVALGATVVTNTITGATDALINNSAITALGAGDGVQVAEHKSVPSASSATDPDPVQDYEKYQLQETAAASATAKKGLVVDAQAEHVLRDISVTGGVAVGSAAGVAVDATVVINSISGSTSAQVKSTDINKDRTVGELSAANVAINAFDKTDISSHLDTLSVGAAGSAAGVGAAGAGDRNTVQRNTIAQILGKADNRTVLNGNNIAVDALGYTKIHLSETGLAAGASATAGAAVTGSVSVNRFAGNTTALVSQVQGTAHELAVQADRLTDMQTYNNAISLSGGIVGASISVGVTDIEDTSHTNAELSHATINADGAADSRVAVKAQNNTQLGTELSADSLEISLGESWGIAVSNVNMEAQVGAKLDEATLGSAQQEFGSLAVEANNNTYSKFQNVAVAAGSIAGVGVGHGALNINTGTAAQVLHSSAFAKDIAVNALEKRTVDTLMVGVGGAAIYVGVNTMHTNIGTKLQDSYDYAEGNYQTDDFQTMVNGALERMNSQADAARTKTSDSSIQQGSSVINKGRTEQGGISNTISNSSLVASANVQANAKATTNTDTAIYQATVAILNVGVPASRTTVEDKLNLNIQSSTLQGKSIAINSTTDGEIKSFAGQGGVSGASYVDTTASIKHLGSNTISIDGSTLAVANALSDALNPLNIHALNETKLNNRAWGLNMGIAEAGRLVLEGEDSTEVNIALGMNEKISDENSFSSSKQVEGEAVPLGIAILAENAAQVKDEIVVNESVGGIAAGGSVVASKAKGKATLDVSGKNAFTAASVALEALNGGTGNTYTTEAINHSVGVGLFAVHVDKVRTYNEMQAATKVGAIKIIDKMGGTQLEPATLKIGATNATSSKAYIHSVNVGLDVASGSNFAESYANGQAIVSVDAGSTGISAKSFDIFAANSDDILTKADGTTSGIIDISPYAAKVKNDVTSTTEINLSGKFTSANEFKAQALRKDVENFKADALSVTIAGGGDARVDSDITANTALNLTGATINSGGATLLAAENTVELNQKDGYNKMVLGQGYAGLAIDTCGIDNTINSSAHVQLKDSSIQSAGQLQTIAHTEEKLQVNSYVYTVGLVGGSEAKVKNELTNDEAIQLQNSSLKTTRAYQDLILSAADDVKLFTYSYAEDNGIVVGGASAILNNNLLRSNKIDILGGSSLYSSQDVNLYAGKLADGSLAMLDLDAEAADFVGSLVPITIKPSLHNQLEQNNQISVDATSSSASVRHSNLYAAAGREMARLTTGRYVGFYSSSQEQALVTTDKGETITGKKAQNSITIDGKLIAGVANKIDITIGEERDIVVLDQAMRDAVSGAKDDSELKITINADESTGLSRDSLTFASEDYANTLYKRYNELMDLMNEYGKDDTVDAQTGAVTHSAAYLGYQAEAKRILNEMLDMGLAEQTSAGKIVPKASLLVDYVEIPELVASGGNISVETDDLQSASGTLQAKGSPAINITNNTNLLTKLNSITVEESGGKLLYNGTEITGANLQDYNNKINSLNKNAKANFQTVDVASASGSVGSITIKGLYDGNSINYSYIEGGATCAGSYRPMANIQVQGNLYAKDGSITIHSEADSIVIQGRSVQDAVGISAATITLEAAQSITQGYTDGIVNIGGDVREQYDAQYQSIIEDNGTTNGTYEMTQVGSAPAKGSKGSGSYIAGGSIYINASDINVNGIIQSGYGDYYADISDFKTQSKISAINNAYNGGAISDSVVTSGEQYKIIDGGAYWDDTAQCYKYRLNVYYNPSTQKILVQNVDASGGKIYLTGRISSTGNGKIICLDGVSNISVNNTTKYDLQLGDLVTHDVQGLVSITDTAKNTLTEITSSTVTVKDIDAKGKVSATGTTTAFDPTTGYDYAPQKGLRYTWTSGVEDTRFNRYKNDFKDGGWGLWDNGISNKELAEWHQTHPIDPFEPGQSYNGSRDSGETIRVTTGSETYKNSVTISSNTLDTDTVKESERWYSTGLWGYHKHYEVIWTESTGTVYTYDASVKADNTFNINFVGHAADSASVTVNSTNNIELNGNIGNTQLYQDSVNGVTMRTEKGTVSISSQKGSLLQSGGAIYAADVYLNAAKDMQGISIVAGDSVNLSAINLMESQNDTAQQSIDIKIKGAGLAKGNVVLGNIGSVTTGASGSSMPINAKGEKTTGITGSVTISTSAVEGNITQAAGSLMVSDRIDLHSQNGAIYGQKQADGSVTALRLYAGQQSSGTDSPTGMVNASALGDIALEQVNGNLRLGRIYATRGDVILNVPQGSVEDALPYVANDRGTDEERLARWRSLGIIAGDSSDTENAAMIAAKTKQLQSANDNNNEYAVWDTYALLYAIQDSLLNPDTSVLPESSDKEPNIIGHNITINVADSVGLNSDTPQRIDMNTLLAKDEGGNYLNLDKLMALSRLDASTKIDFETDSVDGHLYAVYTETLPIGVQQTFGADASGKAVLGELTVQTAASGAQAGDIYLQGREQLVPVEGSAGLITGNLNLSVAKLETQVGDIVLTSLGGIYNAANATAPVITGRSLALTAAGGSIGTADSHLTTALLGSDKTKDGLSAIASAGIYVDQGGSNALIVRNISSGDDIFLGSDTDMFMGVVNGTEAVSYIRAENNGAITLEARNGSIGEAAYDNGTLKRDANNGVRILNSSVEDAGNVSHVTLRASEDVYVTGVASSDGQTAAAAGPAGVLNLTIEGKDASGSAVTLQNVGIYVDGALNLEKNLSASETISAYLTDTLTLNKNISITAPDVYLGSAKDILLQGGSLTSDNKVNLEAGSNLLLQAGSIDTLNLVLQAAGYIDETYDNENLNANGFDLKVSDTLQAWAAGSASDAYGIDLGSRFNQLQTVVLDADNGNIIVGNGGSVALQVSVQAGETVNGDILITNYKAGTANDINIQSALKATGSIEVANEEGDINVNTNTVVDGSNVLLYASENIHNEASITSAQETNLLAGNNINNGASIASDAYVVMSTIVGDIHNHGSIAAANSVDLDAVAGNVYNYADISVVDGTVDIFAGKNLINSGDVTTSKGSITLLANKDILNTGVMEAVQGDISIISKDGIIFNVLEADLLTGKGNVTLRAESQNGSYYYFKDNQFHKLDEAQVRFSAQGEPYYEDENQNKYAVIKNGSVFNAGDILALRGTITMEAVQGNVTNYDDFDTLYSAATNSLSDQYRGMTIATGNIVLKAENGTLYNDKDYLVALGDVTLVARYGLGSYGDVILAGGSISMSDTDGDLINQANLISLSGDITLNASEGTVVNMTKGEVIALNGNVELNAGGAIDADHRIYLVNDSGSKVVLDTVGVDVGDRIIITESYYLDASGAKQFLSNTAPTAPSGAEVYTQISYINDDSSRVLLQEGISGQWEAFRAGDVVNRGDIVAQRASDKELAAAGNVKLNSAPGNVTNYDDYKLVDGQLDSAGQGYYDYFGASGYTTGSGLCVKFNDALGGAYTENKRYILSDSGTELKAPEGYLYNALAIISKQDVVLESGKDLTIGTNFASVEAEGDVIIRSTQGSIYNNSVVISKEGSIVLDAETGVTSGTSDSLQAANGSISAVTTYGEINMDELIAGEMAVAGTKAGGAINIGTIRGAEVVLYTEDAGTDIIVNDITVGDQLLLQGNSFKHEVIQPDGSRVLVDGLGKINRSSTDGALIVDVNGVAGIAPKTALDMEIEGDVRFTTLNVNNANISIGGQLGIDRLHVGNEAHFTSLGYVTGVYGGSALPKHDASNALYYDLGEGTGSGGLQPLLAAEDFRAVREGEQMRALTTMKQLKEGLKQAGSAADTFGQSGNNNGWMNLYVDSVRYQRSNGLLLHIDTGYASANQRWSAEDLSAKLADFQSHDAYRTAYGDAVGIFARYDLLELPVRPASELLHSASIRVVLQKDNEGLRIEEEKAEE